MISYQAFQPTPLPSGQWLPYLLRSLGAAECRCYATP